MPSAAASVCVIVAAKDAVDTIGRAVRSALAEAEVAEVIVIDDGSGDGTAAAARQAEDGSGRLLVVELAENRGPSHARNVAIERSAAPLIAILDADDFFLPGRFERLLDGGGWDLAADNIVFVDSRQAAEPIEVPTFAAEPSMLELAAFIEGNISRRGAARGEIGFLKPVMRRAFLDAHGLRYDETMRLGEDYDLYAQALACGARYEVRRHCGYAAVVRADSLSGRHRTADLRALYEADRRLLAMRGLPHNARAALRRHEKHVRDKYELRRFLDSKRENGLVRAGAGLLARPSALPAVVSGIAGDKWHARAAPAEPLPRYLLSGRVTRPTPAAISGA